MFTWRLKKTGTAGKSMFSVCGSMKTVCSICLANLIRIAAYCLRHFKKERFMTNLETQLHNKLKESMSEYNRTKSEESKRAAKAYSAAHTVEVTSRMKGKIINSEV